MDNNIFHAVPLSQPVLQKDVVITSLSQRIASELSIDSSVIEESVVARERLGGTTLTDGIATPHAIVPVDIPVYVGISVLSTSIQSWRDIQNNPIRLLITFVVSENVNNENPSVIQLKRFFRNLANESFTARLAKSSTEEDALNLIYNELDVN